MEGHKEFEDFVKDQFAYGRKKLESMEKSVDDLAFRISALEKAKIYFDGMKAGAVWAIGVGIAAIIGAAVMIINKLSP